MTQQKSWLDRCYCPGCGKRIPVRNNGCRHCHYLNGRTYSGRLYTLMELLARPDDETLDDVSPAFLRMLSAASYEWGTRAQQAPVPVSEQLPKPSPPAEREVAELVVWLHGSAEDERYLCGGPNRTSEKLDRIATLLQQTRVTAPPTTAKSEHSNDRDGEESIKEKILTFKRRIRLLEESQKITQEILDTTVSAWLE